MLETAAKIAVLFVALIHVYILILEMFLWNKPRGMKTFGLKPDFANQTKVLAANQGLYNGFLAAGLFWGLYLGTNGTDIQVFFLLCVFVAGLYGGVTASKAIIFVQAIPAAIALVLVFFV